MPESVRGRLILRQIDALAASRCGCRKCGAMLDVEQQRGRHGICPECGAYRRLGAFERIDQLTDAGSFEPRETGLRPADPLEFTDRRPYRTRLSQEQARTGLPDAAVVGTARIGGHPVALAVLDFGFLGGSMGSVVGEKVARIAEYAAEQRLPLVTVSASGGARMQEGVLSLFQMAKTAAAVRRLRATGSPFVSVLTDPVYGGVAASFAALGDVTVAETSTRAGFAGPQVVRQTIGERLPAGFQTAEFLLEHGHVDLVVSRDQLVDVLVRILAFCSASRTLPADHGQRPESSAPTRASEPNARNADSRNADSRNADSRNADSRNADSREADIQEVDIQEVSVRATDAWEAVRMARAPGRPTGRRYVELLFTGFLELHGDRCSGDDPAVLGGLGWLDDLPVLVIATVKGTDTADNVRHNFGMPHPSGYRKAVRLFELADHLGLPVVTLVDTPGAYPGLRAEQTNQSGAIAYALATVTGLRVPVVSVVTGEGGSGGALALAAADALLMQEHSILSVISPEGCATILFGDASRAPEAARALRLQAGELHRLGVVDVLVPEPLGGSQSDPAGAAAALGDELRRQLRALTALPADALLARRYRRLRDIGVVRHEEVARV